MKFGDNLRKLRKSKKLSQEDLAEKVSVSRQSVSKWETGDAYPEMNNILELCKIFHCRINDLVNDSIIDIDSLDEEIKMNVVKFKSEQQRKMKGLSKAISIIAKIGRIITLMCVPIIVATMIILGVVINMLEISENQIKWRDNVVTISDVNYGITIKVNDKVISESSDDYGNKIITDLFKNVSKTKIIVYVETGFTFLIVCLIISSMMFKSLALLFDNINKGDTPFTLENVGHIKRMAYLMIALVVFPNIVGAIFELLFQMDLNVGFEMFNLVEILFLFSIAYIFEYGYEIQLDSKGKMYGDENE